MAASGSDTGENRPFSDRAFARGLVILRPVARWRRRSFCPTRGRSADALPSLIAMLFLICRYVESDWFG
jgi:hypothetical protein